MLSRTADNLFWLSRYIERAENLARILDVASRLANLPSAYAGTSNEWESAVATAACVDTFHAAFDEVTPENVIEFLAFSPTNPGSIRNCIETARHNARAVRTALTVEMWEIINSAWLELQSLSAERLRSGPELARFLAWVKEMTLRFDGIAYRTMLRNDAYYFSRLGFQIERADNTARILDVKYHVLLPQTEPVGGGLDYFQWAAVLRSVSALTSYNWIYRDSVKPWLVADFLILREEMPRSLACCYGNIVRFLDELAVSYGRQGDAQRLSRRVSSDLRNATIEGIFQGGLHEFISQFIVGNNHVAQAITKQFLT